MFWQTAGPIWTHLQTNGQTSYTPSLDCPQTNSRFLCIKDMQESVGKMKFKPTQTVFDDDKF